MLHRSPLLLDADLVEAVASGETVRQAAVAMRALLPCSVAAAIAEVGCAEACLILLENPHAEIVPFSLDRIVERHGHLAAIRDALLNASRPAGADAAGAGLKLSQTLAEFVSARAWLAPDRAQRITREACEKATVALAAELPETEVRPLIRHLCESGQLNAGLILRSLLSGNVEFFEEALAELAEVPLARVAGIVHDRRGASFRALYDKAGLAGVHVPRLPRGARGHARGRLRHEPGGASRLKRRIIERALTRCENEAPDEIEPLLTLLRRFAAEAAREEARLFCDELVAQTDRDRNRSGFIPPGCGVVAQPNKPHSRTCVRLEIRRCESYSPGGNDGLWIIFRISGRS